MLETIRTKAIDLTLTELERLLRTLEADLFQAEQKRICGLGFADPRSPDAGHNLIFIDASASRPPADIVLAQFPIALNEQQLAAKLLAVEAAAKRQLRCYGNLLVSGQEAVVALFDPVPSSSPDEITIEGRMSTFGGPDDRHMTFTENLAWIENEEDAAAYPGFFLPRRGGEGFARRLRPEAFYLACRWDYSITPKRFLAQPTTLCTITNPANGRSVEARPIDFGPHAEITRGRNVDVSPGVARVLGLNTDDVCRVVIPTPLSAPREVVPPAHAHTARGQRSVVFLTGDYASRHQVRQRQARASGCSLTIDFHFNSNGSKAHGGEVYFKTGHAPSRDAAEHFIAAFHDVGLGDHGNPLKEAREGRAGFIDSYRNTAVLLEPLFVSNPNEAAWLHDATNFANLARAIADAARASSDEGAVVGLSIGHLGKDSSPSDRGARCCGGDMEATHGAALAHAVAKLLMA